MNKAKHTPGPWTVCPGGQVQAQHFADPDRRLEEIAQTPQAYCENQLFNPAIDQHTVGVWLAAWRDRCQANAMLIAGAPDLLVACKAYICGDAKQRKAAEDLMIDAVALVEEGRGNKSLD